MAYEKQTWKTGEVITAEKLNHIEDGIDGNGFYLINGTETGISASYNELVELSENGIVAIRVTMTSPLKISIFWLSSLGHDDLYRAEFVSYDRGNENDQVNGTVVTFISTSPDEDMGMPA